MKTLRMIIATGILAGLSLTANALTEEVDGVTWTYSINNGKATVTSAKNFNLWLNVPSTLGGYSVTSVGDNAFYGITKLLVCGYQAV